MGSRGRINWRTRRAIRADLGYGLHLGIAVEVSRRVGLSALTFDLVSRLARTAKSTVRVYFPTIKTLQHSVLDAWDENLVTYCVNSDRSKTGLLRAWRMFLGTLNVHARHGIPLEFLRAGLDGRDPDWDSLKERATKIFELFGTMIQGQLELGRERGELVTGADIAALTARFSALTFGVGWRTTLLGDSNAVRLTTLELRSLLLEASSPAGAALLPSCDEAVAAAQFEHELGVLRRLPIFSPEEAANSLVRVTELT